MKTHQWQYQRRGEREFILGDQAIKLDEEGFFLDEPDQRLSGKLAALEKRGVVKLVALDNEGLWRERIGRAEANLQAAEVKAAELERELIRSHDFIRVCRGQLRELNDEWARYRALVSGVPAARGSDPVEPAGQVTRTDERGESNKPSEDPPSLLQESGEQKPQGQSKQSSKKG
ncbi:MAG TPA: hypothetical protein PK095_00500 [Myxococcota bacterium]|nr:hypothetical protein [Myxococcota bacterium]